VAKLRATRTDGNPLLFRIDMGAGHGGPSGRYDAPREIAFDHAFVLGQLGLGRLKRLSGERGGIRGLVDRV
jgi:oligopeptidase B